MAKGTVKVEWDNGGWTEMKFDGIPDKILSRIMMVIPNHKEETCIGSDGIVHIFTPYYKKKKNYDKQYLNTLYKLYASK